jgi:hypothetical protein
MNLLAAILDFVLLALFALAVAISRNLRVTALVLILLALLVLNAHAGTGNRVPVGSGAVGLQPVMVTPKAAGNGNFAIPYPPNAQRWAWTLQFTKDGQTWQTLASWPRGLTPAGFYTISPLFKYRMSGN